MPSDTAFLGDLEAGVPLATAYDSLGQTVDGMPRTVAQPMGKPDLSPRMLAGAVNNLRALGVDIDENNRILRGLRAALVTHHSLYLLYNAWAAKTRADQLRQTAMAAGETTAMAVAQQWHLIAQASAAAIMTAAFFKVGEKFGSGDWKFPSVNISNPVDRRSAARRLATTGG